MRPDGPVFQFYRMVEDQFYWWRMISKNGRRIAVVAHGCATFPEAQASLTHTLASLELLQPMLTVGEPGASPARWRWVLTLDRIPVVRGVGDHDRRVRCDEAWRAFVSRAPFATVDQTLYTFRRGHAAYIAPPLRSGAPSAFVPRSSPGVPLVDLPRFDRPGSVGVPPSVSPVLGSEGGGAA